MICKDCRPIDVEYEFKGVKLCPLHAAAPELLDACRKVLALFDSLETALPQDDNLRQLRAEFHAPYRAALQAAIEKAEGRS